MGFGGSVSAMITTLKNNKRDRKSTFDTLKDHNKKTKNHDKLVFDKEASKEQLQKIRNSIQKENRKKLLINGIGILVIAIGIFVFLTQLKIKL
ncbi:conserved hypothetical protein [Tenacibaculum sp. 190524A05c]|uniref:hypothetical protein n=1 Tax=Tenacibaculum platacis TaxID=3137852 RepID=UPI0031FA54B4